MGKGRLRPRSKTDASCRTRALFLIDGVTGKVMATQQVQTTAQAATDTTEAGEGPNDADSGNEDAN